MKLGKGVNELSSCATLLMNEIIKHTNSNLSMTRQFTNGLNCIAYSILSVAVDFMRLFPFRPSSPMAFSL